MPDPNDWEYEYNGLLFGGLTNYGILKVEGLEDAKARERVLDWAQQHGSYTYARYRSEKRINMAGRFLTPGGIGIRTVIDPMRDAFVPQQVDVPLRYKLPNQSRRRIYVKPVIFEWDIDDTYAFGANTGPEWKLQLLAGDPRTYEDAESSLNLSPEGSSGINFNLNFDMTFGGNATNSGVANNAGNTATFPTARIDGPSIEPVIGNTTTEEYLKITTSLAAGEWIDIDFFNAKITKNGNVNIYGAVTEESVFFALAPGNNTIVFNSEQTGNLLFKWRGAWI